MSDVVRIGNCSGFYGDRLSAMREMLEGGELDVLTGDYLAELTMLILGKDQLKDPTLGYARTFVRQVEDCLGRQQLVGDDRGGRLQGPAAPEHCEAPEQHAFGGGQQLVTPVDRGAQRLLACLGGPRSTRQEPEAVIQAGRQVGDGQARHPGCGQFQRQR